MKKLNLFYGFLALFLFALVVVLEAFGIFGSDYFSSTVAGEILFAVVALVVVLIARAKPGEVFPVKRVRLLPLVGVYLMWRSVYLFGLFFSELMIYFFPSSAGDSAELVAAMADMPFWQALLMVAILPSICEEMLFRGTVLRSLGKFKPAVIIVVDAAIFSLAHLSPVKIISIFLLGLLLAYLTYSSDNILYSMFTHFINNALAVAVTYGVSGLSDDAGGDLISQAAEAAGDSISLVSLGVMLGSCCFAPLIFYFGNYLFRKPAGQPFFAKDVPIRMKKEWVLLTLAIGLLVFAVSFLLMAFGFEDLLKMIGLK